MAPRRLLGCLSLAALLVSGSMGCSKGNQATAELDKRCEQLAKACGDNDKHIANLVEECKQAAKQQAEKKCSGKAIAAYDCFEKELCGGGDKVWTLDDLRVLANRHKKCVAEQKASSDCLAEEKK